MQSHPLPRTRFGQYQTLPAALGDREMGTAMHAHIQLNHGYLVCTVDIMHVTECTSSPLVFPRFCDGEGWKWSYKVWSMPHGYPCSYVYKSISQHNTVSDNVSRDCMVFIYAKNTSIIEAQIFFFTYLISDPRCQKFKLSNYTRSSEQQDMVALW